MPMKARKPARISLRQLEEVVLSISGPDQRIIAFTSPGTDRLVGPLARRAAEFIARSGKSVLVIDLQQTLSDRNEDIWTVQDMLARKNIVHNGQGLDFIKVAPNRESRYAFSDTDQIRVVLNDYLELYHRVVLVLSPVLGSPSSLNPLPVAAASDVVLLTCRRGGIRRSLLTVVARKLQAARCVIGGIVLNETDYWTTGAEVANAAFWLLWPLPWLRKRVQKWALTSDLLD
jgi:hypothetical protein